MTLYDALEPYMTFFDVLCQVTQVKSRSLPSVLFWNSPSNERISVHMVLFWRHNKFWGHTMPACVVVENTAQINNFPAETFAFMQASANFSVEAQFFSKLTLQNKAGNLQASFREG